MMNTKLPTLYSRTSTGAINQWTIEIDQSRYRTIHGQVDGQLVTTEWTQAEDTNAGRANHRSPEQQALFEAKAKWTKKKKAGNFQSVDDIDKKTFVKPMLAKNWADRKDSIKYPVFCQPKFDGARCIISKYGAFSRNGKPWLTIPFILEELKPVFEKFPDLVLDGELYNHELKEDFNKIMSLIKRTKPTEADIKESKSLVEFHWYDICDDNAVFNSRSFCIGALINQFNLQHIKFVETYKCKDLEELDYYYGDFIERGYEGQMVRLNSKYEFKRSSGLIKRKEFMDDDYKIIDICEGNGNKSGMAGYMILERDDGVQFRSNIKGNHPFLRKLLKDKSNFVNKYATCKFFNLTPDGIPRFPYVIKFRNGKGVDN